jgi:lysozyme family protein
MKFSKKFNDAFNHTMLHEVGPLFDESDPEVINGKCETREQQRKVGYVNHPADPGGETKFGIAKNANPNVDIEALTLDQAKQIYFTKYWKAISAENFDSRLSFCMFDAAVNHGVSAAAKMLQRAVGVDDDGIIGRITLGAIKKFNSAELCDIILKSREELFYSIVRRKPSQKIFLKGWLNRLAGVKKFIDSLK